MQVSFKAELREKMGSSEARRIKAKNLIPAVIYGKNTKNINISVSRKEFEYEYQKGNIKTSVISLQLGNEVIKTTIGEIEVHPVSDSAIHINFLPCVENKEILAQPAIVFENREKSPGLKKGGFLHIVLRRAKVFCADEANIPNEIKVDVGSMHMGEKIRANNVVLPQGVRFANRDNFLIGSIIGRGKSDEEKAPVAAEATAAPAASAAKPAAPAAKK